MDCSRVSGVKMVGRPGQFTWVLKASKGTLKITLWGAKFIKEDAFGEKNSTDCEVLPRSFITPL